MKMTSQAGDKYVFAHFMMGNTYPYKPENFLKDIRDAVNTGVDGFALNLGQDEWTSSRVETFFSVARDFPSFKLFFSFDMSIIKEPNVIVEYILQYVNHPNSFHYRGRYFVSTFAGENESFGHGDINTGWDVEIKQRLKQNGVEIHFVPSWTGYDAWNMFRRFPVVDGAFSWAAWSIFFLFSADRRPYPDHDTPTKYDTAYRVTAREYGKTYMAGVSPCFFAHFPWKNWVYPDLTLLVRRFREIIKTQADLIQIISWNGNISTHDIVEIDWGESHYIGTLQKEAGIPEGAEKWITGFNHEPWRDICRWFIQAYKFGRYPEVTKDQLIFWYPPHLNCRKETCPTDTLPCPSHAELVKSKLVAAVFLEHDSNSVKLESGGRVQQFHVDRGFHLFEIDLRAGQQHIIVRRQQKNILEGIGKEIVTSTPKDIWNYNLYVYRG